MNFEDREQHKEEGRQLYRHGASLSERARGLHMIVEAHYHNNSKPPLFETYASHFLWAAQSMYDREVLDLLAARYSLPKQPQIQLGYSDWDSYGRPEYKIYSARAQQHQ